MSGRLPIRTGGRAKINLKRLGRRLTTRRVSFSTLTTKNDLRVLTKAHELWLTVVQRLKTEAKGPWEGHQLYQPIPPTFGKDSVAHGGNVLGLDRFDETLVCEWMFLVNGEFDGLIDRRYSVRAISFVDLCGTRRSL